MRLTFDIDDKTWQVLSDNIPHGHRKYIYKALMEGLARQLNENRISTLAAIIAKQWNIKEFLLLTEGGDDGRSRDPEEETAETDAGASAQGDHRDQDTETE